MRLSTFPLAAALGLSLLCATVRADDTSTPPDLVAIRAQQTELRAQVAADEDLYGHMDERQRQDLVSRQDRVLQLLDGKQSFDELNENDQLEVFNALEWIKGAVNDAQGQRMICTREAKVGSHRKVKVCKTAEQREREHEEAQRKLQHEFRGSTPPPRT